MLTDLKSSGAIEGNHAGKKNPCLLSETPVHLSPWPWCFGIRTYDLSLGSPPQQLHLASSYKNISPWPCVVLPFRGSFLSSPKPSLCQCSLSTHTGLFIDLSHQPHVFFQGSIRCPGISLNVLNTSYLPFQEDYWLLVGVLAHRGRSNLEFTSSTGKHLSGIIQTKEQQEILQFTQNCLK